jgi:hypothetical protein
LGFTLAQASLRDAGCYPAGRKEISDSIVKQHVGGLSQGAFRLGPIIKPYFTSNVKSD